ncbi:hypothetical protein BDZ94DRAFT_1179626, partial [Collybia nuda]
LMSILESSKNITSGTPLTLVLHSSTILKNLTIDLSHQEDRGWQGTQDKTLYKAVIAELRQRNSPTLLRTFAPTESNQKQKALSLANQGKNKQQPNTTPPTPPPEMQISGICLSVATQALMYKGIQEQVQTSMRKKTSKSLDTARLAAKLLCGRTLPDADLWISIRQRSNLSKSTRSFLWKNFHDAYKIGKYWKNIPDMEHRSLCCFHPTCTSEETMEHILIECKNSSATNHLWDMAKSLWIKKDPQWPKITYGTILACNTADFKTRGKSQPGKNRLFAILISETAHLIWKTRCEKVFQRDNLHNTSNTKRELGNKWIHCINTRLKLDRLQTNHHKFGKKALKESLVMDTWKGILKDEENLPKDWIRQSSVLVGIRS